MRREVIFFFHLDTRRHHDTKFLRVWRLSVPPVSRFFSPLSLTTAHILHFQQVAGQWANCLHKVSSLFPGNGRFLRASLAGARKFPSLQQICICSLQGKPSQLLWIPGVSQAKLLQNSHGTKPADEQHWDERSGDVIHQNFVHLLTCCSSTSVASMSEGSFFWWERSSEKS